ncbi:MAG: N-acetylneuraminate synthase family protein [Desulfarculus sp.]|nr:N-acetylneuraminate synthase family protein [Desulfarculus sp.]
MGQKVFIIAEVGSVHDGSLGNAKRLIDAASACGADAVKFQTHIAEAETTRDAPMPGFFTGEPRYQYFERTGFGLEQWCELKARCDERGVEFLSSPFSQQAVELLEAVGVARYKVASGEVTNLPLLTALAKTGKPLLLSSGMSSWLELDQAVETVRRYHDDLVVLQCTSEYPCPYEQVGLNVLAEMRARYGLPVGLSDHTLTTHASLAAVTLGASVIERHFTFSRLMYGSDAPHSLEPAEFKGLVEGVQAIETMLAHPVDKSDAARFGEMKRVFEKSLVALGDIPAGAVFTPALVGVKKPGTGLPAARLSEVLGRRARRFLAADAVIQEEDVLWD